MDQFTEKIIKINKVTTSWAKSFNKKASSKILEVEGNIGLYLIDRSIGTLSNDEEEELGFGFPG
jgi:hypothetical protein